MNKSVCTVKSETEGRDMKFVHCEIPNSKQSGHLQIKLNETLFIYAFDVIIEC